MLRTTALLLLLLAALWSAPAGSAEALRVEAVASDWLASEPPAEGWVEVSLPDNWQPRWPAHDGVVWYRLRWQQPAPQEGLGLYVEYVNLAAEIEVNGALLARDPQRVEPLSRLWNSPRHWHLPTALQRSGENTVLIRVSGFAAYAGGLGPVAVGEAAALAQRQVQAQWLRQGLAHISVGIGITLGLFFLLLWLLRRREVAYGWFAAQQLAWFPIAWNQIALSPWPFASTHAYQSMTTVMLMVFSGCWAMFVLRFCEQRWPRPERALWLLLAAASLAMVLAPDGSKREVRELLLVLAVLVNAGVNLLFVALAARSGRIDHRILAGFALLSLFAGVHDALQVMGLLGGETYYATLTLNLTVIGVAVVLAWNFARSLRRIEGFNAELGHRVEAARSELADTLQRQHELELTHARLSERIGLVHDLHDGIGGKLVSSIASLRQAPQQPLPASAVLDMFEDLRDDLRLIIDGASAQHYGQDTFADLLAPVRHRLGRLFEAHDIDVDWRLEGLDGLRLRPAQGLDLLRVLQEGLVNVFNHSGARRVEVGIAADDEALRLEVIDDGRGFGIDAQAASAATAGTGLRSMRARAERLGAGFSIESSQAGTRLRMILPLSPALREPDATAPR
ncbi:MAG: ATP-binding protein [Aquimonas sp.]|nr:ATP-binding protein [Aquimonas sp.]